MPAPITSDSFRLERATAAPLAVRRSRRPFLQPLFPLVLLLAACSGGGGGAGASTGAAALAVAEDALDFGDRAATEATLHVRNAGAGALAYQVTVDRGNGPPGWLAVIPDHGTSRGETDALRVVANRTQLAPGTIRAALHVVAGGTTVDVSVRIDTVAVAADPPAVAFGFGGAPVAVAAWNRGAGQLAFSAASAPAWLKVDPPDGTSVSSRDRRTLTLSVDRSGLTAGHYDGTLALAPAADQGARGTTIAVALDVAGEGGDLAIAPSGPFRSEGPKGGPFDPDHQDFQLSNLGNATLDWMAAPTQSWLMLSDGAGTLAPGDSTTVTATIDSAVAATLPAGLHLDAIAFRNVTNGNGDVDAAVELHVDDPLLQAEIDLPPDPTNLAPYTALFSALDSVAGAQPIVRWDWDFGAGTPLDPRRDQGKLVAHCFDAPGTYPVTLTVTDAAGATHAASRNVVVRAFSGATFYVSSSQGDDGNDGASATTPFRTLPYAFSRMANQRQGEPDLLLLRRGDTWTIPAEIDPPTPSILDAYGSGADPILEFTTPETGLGWYGGSGGTPDDWGYAPQLAHLHLRHPVRHGSSWLVNAFLRGSKLRGCTLEGGGVIASLQSEGLVLEDCRVTDSRRVGLYSSGDSVVCRRSVFTGSGSDPLYDHQIYLNNGRGWLLEDCLFDGAGTGRNNDAAKLNGGIGVVVRRCEARGSRTGFDAGRNLEEAASPAADDYLYDECVSHHQGFDGQSAGLSVSWIGHLTVRNCVFYDLDPAGDGQGAIWLWRSNDPVNEVRLYHNVFFSNVLPDVYMQTAVYRLVMRDNVFLRDDSAGRGGFLRLDDSAAMVPLIDADHDVYGWSGRAASDPGFAFDGGDANLSFDDWRAGGIEDANGLFGDAGFVDGPDLDFALAPGSIAIDAGELLPGVPRDRAGVARPRGLSSDAGAFER